MTVNVSVVVPVYNGERYLGDCLRALEQQSLSKDKFEILVVADGCTDSSSKVASSFEVRLLEEKEQRGVSEVRNVGVKAARGKWVAFTDQDCIPTRGWLEYLLRAVGNREDGEMVLGAAGRTLGFESSSRAARFVDLVGGLDAERYLQHPSFPFAPSANLMYRKSALEKVGGYDKRFLTYESCELHFRLLQACRGPFYFEPRAIVFHRHRDSWKKYWVQQFGYGRGFGQFFLCHDDYVSWSAWRELEAWANLMIMGVAACKFTADDETLVKKGTFVKQLAQRLGFMSTYWNLMERRKWQ